MKYAYGLENDAPKYAPYAVKVGTTTRVTDSLTEEEAHGIGLKTVNTVRPAEPAPAGSHYEPNGWAETATTITRQWRTVADAPIVHRYSKLRLITACKAAGKWEAVKAWIAAAGYADEWAACMYLSDDYVGFDAIVAAVVTAGIATADEIAAILAAAEDPSLPAEG